MAGDSLKAGTDEFAPAMAGNAGNMATVTNRGSSANSDIDSDESSIAAINALRKNRSKTRTAGRAKKSRRSAFDVAREEQDAQLGKSA